MSQTPQIVLAPLRGLTGALFRTIFAEHFTGFDRAVAPFLTTMQGRLKPGQLREVLPENNMRMPVVPQILSKTAEKFLDMARALADLGYATVNWNLGCPFPRVARKQRGSGMLPHPEQVDAFLDKVFSAAGVRLSIKARLGRHYPDEIFALMPVFNRYPIQELILHPRTGAQMYAERPDLDTFEKCLPLCRCPVVYNGDINTPADFESLSQRFPSITTWMIGRGAVANPFLPGLIKGVTKEETAWIVRFRRFHDALYEAYARVRQGPAHLVDSMKGYWNYFALSFAAGDRILKQVRKARGTACYEQALSLFFEQEGIEHFFDGKEPGSRRPGSCEVPAAPCWIERGPTRKRGETAP